MAVNRSFNNHMDEINTSLMLLGKLDGIINDIELVDENLDMAIEDINEEEPSIRTIDIILLVLLISILGLNIYIIVNSLRKKEQ